MLTLVPGVGVKVNGAQRLIGLGPLRIQPSEFAKLGLILSLASYFAGNQRKVTTFWHGFLLPSVIIGMICGLIILQPDFGTCFLCGAVVCHDDVPSWNVLEMVNAHFWNGRGCLFYIGVF